MAIKVNKSGTLKTIGGVALTGFTIDGIEKYSIAMEAAVGGGYSGSLTFNKKLSSYKYMILIAFDPNAIQGSSGAYARPIVSFHAINISTLVSYVKIRDYVQGYHLCLTSSSNSGVMDWVALKFLYPSSVENIYTIPVAGNQGTKLDVFMIY